MFWDFGDHGSSNRAVASNINLKASRKRLNENVICCNNIYGYIVEFKSNKSPLTNV